MSKRKSNKPDANKTNRSSRSFNFPLENSTSMTISLDSTSLADEYAGIDMDLTIGKIAQQQNNMINETSGNTNVEPEFVFPSMKTSDGTFASVKIPDQTKSCIQVFDWLLTLPTEEADIAAFKSANEAIYYAIVGRAYTDSAFSSDDLTRLFIAESEIACAIKQVRRAIEACGVTSVTNEAIKSRLVYAMGFDGDDLVLNFTSVINAYNAVVREFNKLTLPVGIPSVDKHLRMCSELYADDIHEKTQILIFRHFALYTAMKAASVNGETGVLECRRYYDNPLLKTNGQLNIIKFLGELRKAIISLYESASYQSGFNPKLSFAYRLPKEQGGMELGPIYKFEELDYVKPPVELKLTFDHAMFTTVRAIVITPVYPLSDDNSNVTAITTVDTSGSEEYYTLDIWTRTNGGMTYLAQGCTLSGGVQKEPGLILGDLANTSNIQTALNGVSIGLAITKYNQFTTKILEFGHYPYDPTTAAIILAQQHRWKTYMLYTKLSGTSVTYYVPKLAETTSEIFYKYEVYLMKYVDGVVSNLHQVYHNSYTSSKTVANAINGMSIHPRFIFEVSGIMVPSYDVDNPLKVGYQAIADARMGLWKYAFNYALGSKVVGENQQKPGNHNSNNQGNGKKDNKAKPDDKAAGSEGKPGK